MSGDKAQLPLRRRDFLTRLALGSAGLWGLVALISSLKLAVPRVFSSDRTIRIGRGVDFPMGVATFVEDGECYVVRGREGIRVLSGICPHLGCVVRKTDQGYRCPCHGSEFGPLGERRSGPAPRQLKRIPVRIGSGDQLELDLTRSLPADEPPLRLPPVRQ
jgi:nitrite reductase/ring-hydroxylating ferredoxin subunit